MCPQAPICPTYQLQEWRVTPWQPSDLPYTSQGQRSGKCLASYTADSQGFSCRCKSCFRDRLWGTQQIIPRRHGHAGSHWARSNVTLNGNVVGPEVVMGWRLFSSDHINKPTAICATFQWGSNWAKVTSSMLRYSSVNTIVFCLCNTKMKILTYKYSTHLHTHTYKLQCTLQKYYSMKSVTI